jgi:hypothetical protein
MKQEIKDLKIKDICPSLKGYFSKKKEILSN